MEGLVGDVGERLPGWQPLDPRYSSPQRLIPSRPRTQQGWGFLSGWWQQQESHVGCHQAHLIPVDLYGLYHQCLQHGSVEVPNAAEGTPWSTPVARNRKKVQNVFC